MTTIARYLTPALTRRADGTDAAEGDLVHLASGLWMPESIADAAADLASDMATELAATFVGLNAWDTYATSWVSASDPQPDIGNGTLATKYVRVGNVVFYSVHLTFGSSTSAGTGAWTFSLPVNCSTSSANDYGGAFLYDTGTRFYSGVSMTGSGNVARVFAGESGYAYVGAAVPFTWANGDLLRFSVAYRAA